MAPGIKSTDLNLQFKDFEIQLLWDCTSSLTSLDLNLAICEMGWIKLNDRPNLAIMSFKPAPGNARLPVPLQGGKLRELTHGLWADNFQMGLVGDHFLPLGLFSNCKKMTENGKAVAGAHGFCSVDRNLLGFMLVECSASNPNALTLKLQLLKQILNWPPQRQWQLLGCRARLLISATAITGPAGSPRQLL